MTKPLRDYQEKAITMTARAVSNGARAVCVVLSTGGGKSIIQSEIARRHLIKVPNGRVLITAPRTELIDQLYDTFTGMGHECGVIAAGSSRPINPHRPVQIASIQTLVARGTVVEGISLKLDDECHHMMSEKWIPISLAYKTSKSLLLGFTATPTRADNKGLGEIYDDIVCPVTMKELIALGHLVPYEMIAPSAPLRNGTIAQRPVDAYLTHAQGRKCAVFAGNLKAAAEFLEQFKEAGVPAAVISGQMDSGARRATLDQYGRNELKVLINVGVLTEGWDDPPTSCVILARSLGSVSLYLQILGRGLRPSPKTGKTNAIFIDLHGSSHTFGPPDEDREYSLDGDGINRKGVVANPFRQCIGCGVTLDGDSTVCELCGIARPELVAPEVVNAKLVKFEAKRRECNEARARTLARWMDDCLRKNHKLGAAFHKYKATYGEKPGNDVLELCREIRSEKKTA